MSSSSDYAVGVTTQLVTVPASTGASVFPLNPPPFAQSLKLKLWQGGTLGIFGVLGTSAGFAADAAPSTGYSNAYWLGATEVLQFNGAPRMFLCAGGTQSQAMVVWGLSPNG